MDENPLPDVTERFVHTVGPDRDEILREMDARADDEGFPTVGPAVGGWLGLLARAVDARRVFEFGSGFGYSAYWFARALPDDGEVVLTEIDADELADARDYFERGGLTGKARFEHGDAIEIVEDHDGPFDAVLIDNEKTRYVEAFEAVRGKVSPGGMVFADNAMTAGIVDFEGVLAMVEDEDPGNVSESTRGIGEYIRHVRGDPDFETGVLPLGEGVAVSLRTGR